MNSKFTNSLGIKKLAKDTKVVVAMSGGVDSSTAAGLMKKEGYNVIGVTLKLYDDVRSSAKSRQCCAGQDIMDAKRVANQLNIDHKVLYYQDKFKKEVINNFIESYLVGETPIPCVQCNQTVKFRDLYEYSKELGADTLITGHYVNSIQNNGISEMYRAKDSERDQSYFLFSISRDQLNFLRFPLGKFTKKETREIAKKLKLNVADKLDSQDICFVTNGDYSSIIKKFRPESLKRGNIKDLNNNILGTHDGIINFTIGQRKGIGIANKEPLYVVKINSKNNEVVVGPKFSLAVDKIKLRNLNQLCNSIEDSNSNLFVKVRSTGKLLKAKIKINGINVNVKLENKETGISPGQACVFYSKNKIGDKVLGGGWIDKNYL
jgi:tRNA-specific 2-thiouridylase